MLTEEGWLPGDLSQAASEPHAVTFGAMREALARLWRFCRTPEGLKIVRYTLVSVISALTSLVILTIVYGVLRLWGEIGRAHV